MMRRAFVELAAWFALATVLPAAGSAAVAGTAGTAQPQTVAASGEDGGPVILTVTGLDPKRFAQGNATFDLKSLEALGPVQVATSTIWTEGKHTFTGVPLKALARSLQLDKETVSLHALNDYAAEMPLSEAEDAAPILAYMMDGAPMSVRDKGPIWVIYPYDADASYRSDTAFARSVWQLDRIDVLR